MTMRSGKYYIGDLCYVMHAEWEEVCGLIMYEEDGQTKILDGEFNLKDGRRFAIYSTAHGDGTYFDKRRNEYPVDAGSIGCIRVDDIAEHPDNDIELGNVHDMPEFVASSMWGTITFGHVIIDTDSVDDDEDER